MYLRFTDRLLRYSLAFLIVAVVFYDAGAQRVSAYLNLGYATYSYAELKDYQKSVQRESVADAAITEDFSPFVTYAACVEVQIIPKFSAGIEVGHGSTGGRVYYEDYSGQMIADQLVAYNYVQVTQTYYVHLSPKWQAGVGMRVGLTFHSLKIRNQLTLGDETVHEKADFKAISLSVQPNVTVKRAIGSNFFILGVAGYELQSAGTTQYSEDKKVFLDDGNGQPVHMKGDGLRISVGVGFKFPAGKKE